MSDDLTHLEAELELHKALVAEAQAMTAKVCAENEALRKAYALLENFAQSVGGSSSFWEDFNEELEAASCIVNFGSKP